MGGGSVRLSLGMEKAGASEIPEDQSSLAGNVAGLGILSGGGQEPS